MDKPSPELRNRLSVQASEPKQKYTIVGKAAPFEVLAYIYHNLGLHSNIIVAAKYGHRLTNTTYGLVGDDAKRGSRSGLTSEILIPALARVIAAHPALGIVGVSLPCTSGESEMPEGKPTIEAGKKIVWEALLHHIDLRICVDFLDYDNESRSDWTDAEILEYIEKLHNRWEWTSEDGDWKKDGQPWWRVVVVGGERVFFVYHHFIADGISGYIFHRTLLRELNRSLKAGSNCTSSVAEETRGETERQEQSGSVLKSMRGDVPDLDLPRKAIDLAQNRGIKLSMLHVVSGFLFWLVVRLVVPVQWLFFSDARYEDIYPTLSAPNPYEKPTRTKIETLRIHEAIMKDILLRCRNEKTTFTALLHTLIQTTLAVDVYPNARLGFSRMAVDVRKILREPQDRNAMVNDGADLSFVHWLGKYRDAGKSQSPKAEIKQTSTKPIVQYNLDVALTWQLARDLKQRMNRQLPSVLQDFISGRLMGQYESDFINNGFKALGIYQHNSFLLSNLGALKLDDNEGNTDKWTIDIIIFSSAAMKAAIGNAGLVINVASMAGGECIISVSYEEGVIEPDVTRKLLHGLEARLLLVAADK